MPDSFILKVLIFALPVLALIAFYYLFFLGFRTVAKVRKASVKTGQGRVVLIKSAKQVVVDIKGESKDMFLAYVALAEDVHDAETRARRLLGALLEDQMVGFEIIADNGDNLVAAITQPIDVAAELIRKGLCYARMDAPPSYKELQSEAIRSGTGIWRSVQEKDQQRKGTAWYTKP